MKSRIVITIGLSICLWSLLSCDGNQKHEAGFFSLDASENDTIYYSQFADSISYIKLESSDSCQIAECTDMTIADSLVFIFDKKQKCIWEFNLRGQFVRSLNKLGPSASEYVDLTQFEYDKENKQLLILDSPSKSILHYSIEGDFIDKETIDIYAFDFKISGQHYLISNLGTKAKFAGVYLIDRSTMASTKIIGKKDDISWNNNWEMISWDTIVGIVAPPLENTVFHFSSGALTDSLPILVPRSSKKYGFTDSPWDLKDFKRTLYAESSDWLWLVFWKPDSPLQNIVFNKKTITSFSGCDLCNDIDHIQHGFIQSFSEGNIFTFADYSAEGENPTIQILHLKNN